MKHRRFIFLACQSKRAQLLDELYFQLSISNGKNSYKSNNAAENNQNSSKKIYIPQCDLDMQYYRALQCFRNKLCDTIAFVSQSLDKIF